MAKSARKCRIWRPRTDCRQAVLGFIVNKRCEILLAIRKDDGQLCLPAGKIEDGEDYEVALDREMKEELGITVTSKALLMTIQNSTGMFIGKTFCPDNKPPVCEEIYDVIEYYQIPRNMEPDNHLSIRFYSCFLLLEALKHHDIGQATLYALIYHCHCEGWFIINRWLKRQYPVMYNRYLNGADETTLSLEKLVYRNFRVFLENVKK